MHVAYIMLMSVLTSIAVQTCVCVIRTLSVGVKGCGESMRVFIQVVVVVGGQRFCFDVCCVLAVKHKNMD